MELKDRKVTIGKYYWGFDNFITMIIVQNWIDKYLYINMKKLPKMFPLHFLHTMISSITKKNSHKTRGYSFARILHSTGQCSPSLWYDIKEQRVNTLVSAKRSMVESKVPFQTNENSPWTNRNAKPNATRRINVKRKSQLFHNCGCLNHKRRSNVSRHWISWTREEEQKITNKFHTRNFDRTCSSLNKLCHVERWTNASQSFN